MTIKPKLWNAIIIAGKLLKSQLSKRTWPIIVSFHVTRRCNYSCPMCYASLESLGKADPSTEQVLGIIDGLNRRGTVSIRLLGGEPLMRNDLPQIISRVKQHGMYCEIVTNGSLLEKRMKEWPELRNLDSICISLDGDREIHEKLRGKGTFDSTMNGILAGVDGKFPVRIRSTYYDSSTYDSNENKYPHHFLAKFCKRYDIQFNLGMFFPGLDEVQKKTDRASESYKQGKQIYQDLIEYKKRGVPISSALKILELGAEWFDHFDEFILFGDKVVLPSKYQECGAGVTNCFIDSDGGMYACVPLWKKGISVYKVGLDKAYDYMKFNREEYGCRTCYILSQWEYFGISNFGNYRVLFNTARNIFQLHFKRVKRG